MANKDRQDVFTGSRGWQRSPNDSDFCVPAYQRRASFFALVAAKHSGDFALRILVRLAELVKAARPIRKGGRKSGR